jgi:hypothetical protein
VETELHAFLISEIYEGESLLYASAPLSPEMNPRHLFCKRLMYSRINLDMEEKRKFSASAGIQTPVICSVVTVFADCSISVHETIVKVLKCSFSDLSKYCSCIRALSNRAYTWCS